MDDDLLEKNHLFNSFTAQLSIMQGSLEAQFTVLTILQVQTSWHCGSSIYAKAGKQAAAVELTSLQGQTSQHSNSHIYVTPTKLIYTKASH